MTVPGRRVALLRGINVGGANRLAMADLRTVAESLGWERVTTLLQSGNLVFDAHGDDAELAAALRSAVSAATGLDVAVVVREAASIAAAATAHPDVGGGLDPALLHVAFLDRAPDADAADVLDPRRFAPDRCHLAGREAFLTYPNGSGRSKLTIDVIERGWGVTATARNLNTVRRLADLATT